MLQSVSMLEVLAAVSLGALCFVAVAALALRLLLETLTERNLAYIRNWEVEAARDTTSSAPSSSSAEGGKRRGRHKRRDNNASISSFAFAESVVKECAAVVTLEGESERCRVLSSSLVFFLF